MLNRSVVAVLFFSVVLVISPRVVSAAEPFVINDFEDGLGKWYGSGGGGAINGTIEETADAHDGTKGMKVIIPANDKGWSLAQFSGRGAEFAQLGDKGHEALRFWIKGIKGIDKDLVLQTMMIGIGDHSTDNRWLLNFNAPLGVWTQMIIPFTDFQTWNQEKRAFKIEFLDYLGFYRAKTPWPDMEFIVDQMEVGLIKEPTTSVAPLGKLPLTWGQIKGY